MSSKKIIAVTGATGAQGGSAANFILDDGTFSVRAITRNPNSAAAKALSERGAEVVKADSRDPASLEKAFKGAYGVFGLTNYWEPGVGGDGERAQGLALVDAAKAAGVQHFVWSALDHTEFKAPHWESKADIDDYLRASGLPRTSVYTSFYYENFVGMTPLLKRRDGAFDFPVPLAPDTPFAVYSVEETGAWVLAAFKYPQQWLNQDMRITTEFLSARDMAKAMTDVLGKTVHVHEELSETMKGSELIELIEILSVNMQVLLHNNKPPFRDPELSRKIYPAARTFKAWVEENKDRFPI